MKYIVVEQAGLESAILFDELLQHNDVAGRFRVVSAGFVQVKGTVMWGTEVLETYCYGRSVSLNKQSRGTEDLQLVNRALVNHFP